MLLECIFFQLIVLESFIKAIEVLPGNLVFELIQLGDFCSVIFNEDVVVRTEWSDRNDVLHVKHEVLIHFLTFVFIFFLIDGQHIILFT